ncbi:MAG: glycogen/starch synthase [Balneolales bacterium]|nr:glycogen/starch synthase [Balneolales bacterium]
MKILYAAAEISPFARLTNNADMLRFLPASLQDKGFEIRILLPKYGTIIDRRNRLHEVIRLSGIEVEVNESVESMRIKVASIPNAKLQVYFLDNDTYFKRKGMFKDPKTDEFYPDNLERLIFYNKGVLETVKKLGWQPDIIHCHDWAAGFIPAYMKTVYANEPLFKDTKVVYNIHSPANDGIFDIEKLGIMKLPEDIDRATITTDGKIDFLKAGLSYSDHVVTGNDIRTEFDNLFSEMGIESTKIQGSPQDVSSKFADFYRTIKPEN